MIQILKDCFDRSGRRYKVISISGDRFICESYSTGKTRTFARGEISEVPFKQNIQRAARTSVPINEPSYIIPNQINEVDTPIETKTDIQKKDNSEENGNIYSDF